jgi:hypothetical protein
MRRSAHEPAVDEQRDRPAAPAAPALDGPATVMFLQSTAGNQAVARSLARRALQREPASPGVDHGADASNVAITFVLRDLNLKTRDTSTIDFLHEPGITFQVTPKQAPEPVVQAALSAMNVHLQRHGNDLVELSVGPQAQLGGDKPTVGAQAQAEIHVNATFSITASSSVAASRPPREGEEPDPGSLQLSKPGSSVDITWSPVSIGVLYKLDGAKPPPREEGKDSAYYESIQPGRKTIAWAVSQLDPAEFRPPGASTPLDVSWMATDLFDKMKGAKGEVSFQVDIGVQQEPPGLTRGLARAATLLAGARPDLAGVHTIRLAILQLPPDGKGSSSATRWKQLAVGAAPAAPPEPPPQSTWGTGSPAPAAPAPSGPMIVGPSKVVPAPPPVTGVSKEGSAAPAPRTWGAPS